MSRKFLEWFASSPKSFGVNLEPSETDTEGPLFRGQKGQLFLHQLCKAFIDKHAAVLRDNRLTEQGRKEAVQREAGRLLGELKAKFQIFLDPIANTYKNFDSTNLPAIRGPADALQGIQRLSVQQHIASLGTKERVELLREAMDQNDTVTLGVFFHKPTIFKWLDPSLIAKTRREYLSKNAPDAVQAEKAGAVLAFDIEKVADELSLFAGAGVNPDAVAICERLTEISKLGMTFEPNDDLNLMLSGAMPSNLPPAIFSGLSDGQPLDSAR